MYIILHYTKLIVTKNKEKKLGVIKNSFILQGKYNDFLYYYKNKYYIYGNASINNNKVTIQQIIDFAAFVLNLLVGPVHTFYHNHDILKRNTYIAYIFL